MKWPLVKILYITCINIRYSTWYFGYKFGKIITQVLCLLSFYRNFKEIIIKFFENTAYEIYIYILVMCRICEAWKILAVNMVSCWHLSFMGMVTCFFFMEFLSIWLFYAELSVLNKFVYKVNFFFRNFYIIEHRAIHNNELFCMFISIFFLFKCIDKIPAIFFSWICSTTIKFYIKNKTQ